MRVLVACEFSGAVREAFRRLGHDAVSCDILPTEVPGPHIEGDVLKVLNKGWDMMIAFPPCTYLCRAGIHWNARVVGRAMLTEQAFDFAMRLWNAPIPLVAMENPIGVLSTRFRKPDQVVHPWQFGHPEEKTTCLWLRGLPKLEATAVLPLPEGGRWNNQTPGGWNKLGPGVDRAKQRSKTYLGIATAMAKQWGSSTEPLAG